MLIYAGIDEAGYGPLFGPLTVGRAVFAVPKLDADAPLPNLWQRLSKTVCKNLSGRNGRIAVNDSKKLTGGKSKIKHLESGCLTFAQITENTLADAGNNVSTAFTGNCLEQWLSWLGEDCYENLSNTPWYSAAKESTRNKLPVQITEGEIAISKSMLKRTCQRIGVQIIDLGAAVILEDKFNRMVAQSHSKSATSFTFIAFHLQDIWNKFGTYNPTIIVDRQGGRTRYLKSLINVFPRANIKIVQEQNDISTYTIKSANRGMTIHFQVGGDSAHMPTALASMVAKYTRELLMMRFNDYFTYHLKIAPTAGYGKDGKRFWQEIQPNLGQLDIETEQIKRIL